MLSWDKRGPAQEGKAKRGKSRNPKTVGVLCPRARAIADGRADYDHASHFLHALLRAEWKAALALPCPSCLPVLSRRPGEPTLCPTVHPASKVRRDDR